MNAVTPTQEHEVKGGRWVSPETFAQEEDNLPLGIILKMLKKSPRTTLTFDERDVRRYARGIFRIYVTKPNGAGIRCPRLVQRKARAAA